MELTSSHVAVAELSAQEIINKMTFINNQLDITGILSNSKLAYIVENSLWWHTSNNQRLFFMGNEHRIIYQFSKVKEQLQAGQKPLTIINFDEHIDDSIYRQQDVVNGMGLNAAWQRYMVDAGITDYYNSFNVYPDNNIYPASNYSQEKTVSQFERELRIPTIDILSIDLDFFNQLVFNSKRWNKSINLLKKLARRSKVVMVFTSPVFTKHPQGLEVARILFEEFSREEV